MRERLTVIADTTGVPHAEVPCTCMWALVEYFSYQRVAVTYQYQGSHFIVSFPRQDVDSAQRVLDEWAVASASLLQPV